MVRYSHWLWFRVFTTCSIVRKIWQKKRFNRKNASWQTSVPQVRYILYEKVKRKRSTYGIPEREECSAAERHSQDAVWKVASELEYLERCMHCSTDIPGSSPLTDMMSITKVVPRTISPFVQKSFSVQRAFYVMHLRCIMQRRPFAEGKLSWDDVLQMWCIY